MYHTKKTLFVLIFQLAFLMQVFGQAVVEPDLLIIGRESLPVSGDVSRDTFLFYDGSKAALRFGFVEEAGNWKSENIGIGSLASGYRTVATGYLSSAWGERTAAFSDRSTAFGFDTEAFGNCATAWGASSEASNDFATAWGLGCKANGYHSTAWGDSTYAGSINSTAWGAATRATGPNATAAGSGSQASANSATAFGLSTKALGANSFVIGQYNDAIVYPHTPITETSPLFIIGNGDEGSGNESNAMVVRKNGLITIKGQETINQIDLELASTSALIEMGVDKLGPHGLIFGDPDPSQGMKLLYRTIPNTLNVEVGNDPSSNSANIFNLQMDGDLTIGGSLMQNSDRRLKKQITPLSNSIEVINQLTGYTYFWKGSYKPSRKQIGLIAQEVQDILPELVQEDEEGMLSLDYISIIPVLIEAIKDQGVLIRKQDERIRILEIHLSHK